MKKILVLLSVVLFLAGCCSTTATKYLKKVTVEKDGDGKIVKTIVEEQVIQSHLEKAPIELEQIEAK
ncbi:MAG: hypothetical protein WCY09_01265 [Candidatus Omnitrophota bacterium]